MSGIIFPDTVYTPWLRANAPASGIRGCNCLERIRIIDSSCRRTLRLVHARSSLLIIHRATNTEPQRTHEFQCDASAANALRIWHNTQTAARYPRSRQTAKSVVTNLWRTDRSRIEQKAETVCLSNSSTSVTGGRDSNDGIRWRRTC